MPETSPGQPMEEILASIKRIIAEDAPLSLGPPTIGANDSLEPPKPPVERDDVLELEPPEGFEDTFRPPEDAHDPEPAPHAWGHADEPDPVFKAEPALSVPEGPRYFRGAPITPASPPEYVAAAPALAPAEAEPAVIPSTPAPVAHEQESKPMVEPEYQPESEASFEPSFDPAPAAAHEPEPVYETLLSAGAEAASRQALAALSSLTIDSRAAPNTLDGLVREMLKPMLRDWLDKNLPSLVEQLVAKEIKRLGRS